MELDLRKNMQTRFLDYSGGCMEKVNIVEREWGWPSVGKLLNAMAEPLERRVF